MGSNAAGGEIGWRDTATDLGRRGRYCCSGYPLGVVHGEGDLEVLGLEAARSTILGMYVCMYLVGCHESGRALYFFMVMAWLSLVGSGAVE